MEMETKIHVRTENGAVVMEPGPWPGVQGVLFSVSISPARAMELGHQLISASTVAMEMTCKTGAL